MCGIAGIISINPSRINADKIKNMTDAIAHRGPDGEGVWINEEGTVGLGHRRLSIIDLSHEADQPMHYMNRYTIVFNGEIYNYREIKNKLLAKGYRFSNESDTEVIMALYDHKGTDCLQEMDGMFAFVLYDHQRKNIFAARDRFGEKPFFYHHIPGETFYFASEIKSIRQMLPALSLNNKMVYNYFVNEMTMNPSDHSATFYQEIKRLPKSHFIEFPVQSIHFAHQRYFDIDAQFIDHNITEKEAARQLLDLMTDSINKRLRADVPVGSSLSGGLDSSFVVCLLDAADPEKKLERHTFSARFDGFKLDETRYQNLVIEQSHARASFIYPDEKSMAANYEKVCYHQEEPFGTSSILAQYEVFAKARSEAVPVLLDGQGADEILAGYPFYLKTFFNEIKKQDKDLFATEMEAYQKLHADNEVNAVQHFNWKDELKGNLKKWMGKDRLLQMKAALKPSPFLDKDFEQAYRKENFMAHHDFKTLNEYLYFSTMTYGLEDLLRFADRNAMASSIEVRLPFLQHELVQFVFSLPAHFKIHQGWSKYIQRKAMEAIVPNDITWRKDKIGYEPPQKQKVFQPSSINSQLKDIVKKDDALKAQWPVNNLSVVLDTLKINEAIK